MGFMMWYGFYDVERASSWWAGSVMGGFWSGVSIFKAFSIRMIYLSFKQCPTA